MTPTIEQLRALPKVSLHDHLDGGLRIETILDLADDRGIALPAPTPEGLRAWFDARTTAGSLEAYLEGDAVTSAVLVDVDALVRVARESVEDLAADGVAYAELRWAPGDLLRHGLSMDDAVDAVAEGLRAGEHAVHGRTTARQILCAMRHEPGSEAVAELAVVRDDVVGFDLAGPEVGYPPSLHRPAFELLRANGVPVTVHAGEAAGIDSIREALDIGGARRIGHGIRLVDDFDKDGSGGPLTERIIADGIVLEVCPSSNVHTGAVPPEAAHPFDRLYRAGVPVTVSPDNRLTSRTSLSRELQSLCAAFGYTMADIAVFQDTAAAAAFAPHAATAAIRWS
ncbi:adenosine deaminase [Mycobacterium aquaticum]|uniref:adenosine deaminase n=1 Tax=Mycobacterium aquaticum TaxID=1927124 RepID=A0A1X0BAH9_9MYCO|nr:adenosine deaminase [Mycobacterium aquaticum]ORA39205.1 adenosine deaminase [Mycobacterium aquaticum]